MDLSKTIQVLQKSGLLPEDFNHPRTSLDDLYHALETYNDECTLRLPVDSVESISTYMILFRRLAKMACLPFSVDRVIADRNPTDRELIDFSFIADGQPVKWQFKHQSRWLSEDFMILALDYLKQHSKKSFVNTTPEDEWWLVMSLPEEAVEALDAAGVKYDLL